MRIVYLEEGDFQTEIFYHSFHDENRVLFHAKEIWDTCAPSRTSFVACGERFSHWCPYEERMVDDQHVQFINEESANYHLIRCDRTRKLLNMFTIFGLQWVFLNSVKSSFWGGRWRVWINDGGRFGVWLLFACFGVCDMKKIKGSLMGRAPWPKAERDSCQVCFGKLTLMARDYGSLLDFINNLNSGLWFLIIFVSVSLLFFWDGASCIPLIYIRCATPFWLVMFNTFCFCWPKKKKKKKEKNI